MNKKVEVYYISASTGCSCCSYDNFDRGFYLTAEEPQAIINEWKKGIGNPLGSQYSRYGNYCLRKTEAEILPDGRIIVDDRVFSSVFQDRIDW